MIKAAVIGVGNMGKHHARVYSELDNAKLVAVCDINEKVGKEIATRFNCNFYKNYKEMIEKEDIDAVSVVVPTSLHKEISLDVIDYGKHILVEKPLAESVESAKEIIETAKKKGVKLMVGHIERFNPVVRKLKELLKEGRLGDILTIVIRRVGMFPPQIRDINVILDLAIHDIDVCNFLLDRKPSIIYASAGKAFVEMREDYADIFLNYGGINTFLQVNWITPVKVRRMVITGNKGYAELNYATQELLIYKTEVERPKEETFEDVVRFGKPEKFLIDIEKKEPLKEEIKSFISYIEGGECPMQPEDALDAIKIAYAAFESYKNRKVIKLTL
jgi:UDP-N-acetylglucosamine 3-dehydrogenase